MFENWMDAPNVRKCTYTQGLDMVSWALIEPRRADGENSVGRAKGSGI